MLLHFAFSNLIYRASFVQIAIFEAAACVCIFECTNEKRYNLPINCTPGDLKYYKGYVCPIYNARGRSK